MNEWMGGATEKRREQEIKVKTGLQKGGWEEFGTKGGMLGWGQGSEWRSGNNAVNSLKPTAEGDQVSLNIYSTCLNTPKAKQLHFLRVIQQLRVTNTVQLAGTSSTAGTSKLLQATSSRTLHS